MGEVYRARDTKLNRNVALKVLPHLFALDPDRLARFKREAQLLASLSHPNIAAIYGLEDSDGVQALALELIEGPTLADRIAQRPIALPEALIVARQIADALESAHERGIVHRDLKPANIKITGDGMVKVLDFGLAKALDPTASASALDASNSPTLTAHATEIGMILGTAAYMSPEQARGKPVDKRTDVWAFGCVLYEMITGRPVFARDTVSDTIAAILEREPDWTGLPEATPASVRRLLQRCLDKDPRRRLHDIADARLEIEETPTGPLSIPPAEGIRIRKRQTWQWAIAALALAATATTILLYWTRRTAPSETFRLSVSVQGDITPQLSAAISPDGRQLAYISTDSSGKSMLWIRPLDSLKARFLAGTENAAHPLWSPDGRSLGFVAGGKIKRIEAEGGPVQTLADTGQFRAGAAWNRDGVIIFSGASGLLKIPAAGGAVSSVTTLDRSRREIFHAWPQFLPDGRHFLYFVQSAQSEHRGVYVGSLDSGKSVQLLQSELKAAYALQGYLLFVRDEALMAQPFDAERLELKGEPSLVADGIWVAEGAGQASFSVSPTGVLAYVNATLWNTQLAWFDRRGRPTGSVGPPDRYNSQIPQLAPDASRIAIARGHRLKEDIWILDAADGTASRLTFGRDHAETPAWSADGTRIVFVTTSDAGESRLYLKNANGTGTEELLFSARTTGLQDWSSDGRFLVYTITGEKGSADLWVLPLAGNRQPFPFLQTAFNETQAQISPDGRWLAYTSNESGEDEVYVQTFPKAGSKRQISTEGGVSPRWRRDGKELFYLAADERLMAVPVNDQNALETDRPIALFRTRLIPQGSQSAGLPTQYDVAPDGQRFLLNLPTDQSGSPITVVLNWAAALKE
jgi:serine/threonine protein kinase